MWIGIQNTTSLWFRVKARPWVPPLNTQWILNSAENEKWSVLTLDSLCLLCCVRDTTWNWFFIFKEQNFSILENPDINVKLKKRERLKKICFNVDSWTALSEQPVDQTSYFYIILLLIILYSVIKYWFYCTLTIHEHVYCISVYNYNDLFMVIYENHY